MEGQLGTNDAAGTPARRQRWWIHVVILGMYPVTIGALPFFAGNDHDTALLPPTVASLVTVMLGELAIFTAVFLLAWLASRASAEQLLLKWRGAFKPIWRGLLYSIALRAAVTLLLVIISLAVLQLGVDQQTLERMQPRTEVMVEAEVLAEDPVYFGLTLTLVSFVVAGFREELWRAGMLAGMLALFPNFFGSFSRRLIAVGIAAVLFGFGHFAQGIGGVVVTTLLGFGLGTIMVYHRSIWDAVFAHGFFNATSFVALYLLTTRAPHLLPGA